MKINFSKLTGLFSLLLIHVLPVYGQTCNQNVVESTPDSSFTVNNDGTVTHIPTGLMWKVCSEGQTWSNGSCLSSPEFFNDWSEALGRVQIQNATGYASFSDWRLPNLKELLSIIEFKCQNPSINESIFVATAAEDYWSSTHGGYATHSLGVDFNWGTTTDGWRENTYLSNSFHVRLVRSIQ